MKLSRDVINAIRASGAYNFNVAREEEATYTLSAVNPGNGTLGGYTIDNNGRKDQFNTLYDALEALANEEEAWFIAGL
jgi:hypothetical protein